MEAWSTWLIAMFAAFLCGSIPFGVLIARTRGVDIRAHGSRNIGATNVARVLGRPLGALCFALDALKGFAPTALAGLWHETWGLPATALPPAEQFLWLGTAVAALLGHMFSPWIGFKGGKGVATGFGGLAGIWPALTLPALVALGLWILLVATVRIVSVASVAAAFAVPAMVAILAIAPADGTDAAGRLGTAERADEAAQRGSPGAVTATSSRGAALERALPMLGATTVLSVLIAWKHRSNLARLLRGEEPRIGSARGSRTDG
ncbi:MAG TPA: glycerol-3-phosphate 1-O-acyltransferase PlsY [Phycisphaerales bacterium]|mgnify:CR=1 FL=1|nr:glycerol-3-phosphate 1-O-acyltransferase PlsY [Phycisphaerales bacterium]HMP36461.1 glycerol-3-phosphate 1-O-acyltransferase PlsY [Phycisphaerales bacterium]